MIVDNDLPCRSHAMSAMLGPCWACVRLIPVLSRTFEFTRCYSFCRCKFCRPPVVVRPQLDPFAAHSVAVEPKVSANATKKRALYSPRYLQQVVDPSGSADSLASQNERAWLLEQGNLRTPHPFRLQAAETKRNWRPNTVRCLEGPRRESFM